MTVINCEWLTKYRGMLIIIIGSILIIPLNLLKIIPNDFFPPLIMIFFIFLSWFLVDLNKEQDEKFKKITFLINDQKDHVPCTDQIMESPFEFRKMLSDATRSMFIVGPNLNFLTDDKNKEEIKELLFNKLEKNPQFQIRMLLSDPDNFEICKLMSKISFTETFQKELNKAVQTFSIWKKEALEHKPVLNKLDIHITGVITVSFLFIDAEDWQNARVLVTPVPWKIPGGVRPCFLIKKQQHPSAFNKYFYTYDELFYIAKDVNELNNTFLFCWSEIPGNSEKLLSIYLKNEYCICWAENADISKSDNDKVINILNNENLVKIILDDNEEKATLIIKDIETHELKVKKENSMLNIYGFLKNRNGY